MSVEPPYVRRDRERQAEYEAAYRRVENELRIWDAEHVSGDEVLFAEDVRLLLRALAEFGIEVNRGT